MNERIQELADQAEKYADANFKGEPFWSEAYESKFAELIVRECCKEITYASVGNEDPVFAYTYISHLRKTFDVES
jgi:hypothetical protein